jgi:hypothetical protein
MIIALLVYFDFWKIGESAGIGLEENINAHSKLPA